MNEKKNDIGKKTGAVICVIGRQHSGKTPVIQRMAKNSKFRNKVVYDKNKEYDPAEWSRFFSLSKFRKWLPEAKNCFIVMEEATIYVRSVKETVLTEQIIGIEHNRNVLVLVFHSLMDAPQYVLRLCKFVVLLKTNDDPEQIKTQRPRYYKFLNSDEDQYINVNNLC